MPARSRPLEGARRAALRAAFACLLAFGSSGAIRPLATPAGGAPQPKRPPREIAMTVLLEGRPLGTVQATFPADGSEPQVRGGELAELVASLVRPERISGLRDVAPANELLALSRCRALGFPLELDAATLEIHLDLAPADRAEVDLPLRQSGPPPRSGVPLAPSPRSAFANLFIDLRRDLGSGPADSPLAAHFRVEPAVDLGFAVLEGAADWSRGDARSWRRGPLRLVRDDPARSRRWLLGDLSYPVSGFQAYRPLGGVAVARDFTLDPYAVVQPLGETEFLLASESRVELRVNGRSERTLRLGPGRYRLHDFFLETGLNEIELHIVDAAGKEETLSLSLPFHAELLRPGTLAYAAALGAEAEAGASGPRYRTDRPFLSLQARRGWSATTTFGGGLQAGRDGSLLTGSALVALGWGSLALDFGASERRGAGGGGALRIAVERQGSGAANPNGRRWSAVASARSEEFLTPDEMAGASGRPHWDLLVRLSQKLGARSVIGASLSAASFPVPVGRAGGGTLSVRVPLGAVSSLSLDAGLRHSEERGTERRLTLSWSRTLGDRRQQLHATWDSGGRAGTVDWSYAPDLPVEAWSARAALSRSPGAVGAACDASWSGQRGEVRGQLEGAGDGSASAGLQASLSVVSAGGKVAFGRPVHGAWALLSPHPTLAGLRIGTERAGDRYASRAVPGGGVVPDLTPYAARTLAVEIADLPAGFDPGPGLFRLLPRYKSGTLVPVGTGATAALAGILVDPAGQPLALVSGRVIEGAASGSEPLVFFTNRSGRFRVEGLHPGGLQLLLDDGRKVDVAVPAGARGVVDLGRVTVPSAAAAGGLP